MAHQRSWSLTSPKRASSTSPTRLDPSHYTPSPRLLLTGRLDETPVLLTLRMAEELRSFLPVLQKESREWQLLYSMDQHGISLATLFNKVQDYGLALSLMPCVLVLRDQHGAVFGAFLSEGPARKKGYYGNGHCFLWRQSPSGALAAYLSTGLNEHYILSEPGANLAFGGGDHGFALWLDENLDKAYSNKSATYGNEPLSSRSHFEICGLELWVISP
ncbi:oxidation resistance protein 1 [Kappamyces sp. JEL0829]|nr:oxidation resistance protein 1 [Kappamyces sp. JEL0829]